MLGLIRRSGSLAMLAALALAGGSAPILAAQPTMVSAAPRPAKAGKRAVLSGSRFGLSLYGRKGAGITAAQQKRASRKGRNVVRNRANHR